MIFGSVCSGIEAASAAWGPLGWHAAFVSEIEPFPSAVLAHHYPDVPNLGDMTKYKEWPEYAIDLLVGGTPCQSFSVAGLRKGLDDPRGNLMLTFGAIAGRYRPSWLVWENVPGVLSSNKGKDFGSFLGLITGQRVSVPAEGWSNSGILSGYRKAYGVAWRILDAQYFGVPQRRRRVFVVGYLGDWRPAAAVLFERHSLQGHPAPGRKKGQGVAGGVAACLNSGGNNGGFRTEPGEHLIPESAMLTCGDRGMSVDQASGGMAVPEVYSIMPMNSATDYKARKVDVAQPVMAGGPVGGNQGGDVVICMETGQASAGIGIGTTLNCNHEAPIVAGTLNSNGKAAGSATQQDAEAGLLVTHSLRGEGFDASEDGTGRGTPIIPILEVGKGSSSRGAGPNGCGIGKEGDPMYTLQAGAQHAVCFDTTQITSKENRCNPQPGDPCHPLASGAHAPAVAFSSRERGPEPKVKRDARPPHAMTEKVGAIDTIKPWNVATGTAVRRLTPRECERLQGFEDDYTRIPNWNGWRAMDETETPEELRALGLQVKKTKQGKWRVNDPDGPRYKAIGNSMALPVMRWIGERIDAVDKLIAEG